MNSRFIGFAASILFAAAHAAVAAPTLKTLSIFNGADGNSPFGELTGDNAGNLYGVTGFGGTNTQACPGLTVKNASGGRDVLTRPGCGVAFKLSRNGTKWTETVLHDFALTDGAIPGGALVADRAGKLYGTTNIGGKASSQCPGNKKLGILPGCGVVYELTPPAAGRKLWARTILYEFSGSDGAGPNGNLAFDSAGNLYGATINGGASAACPTTATNPDPAGCGVAFKLSPPSGANKKWTETVLYGFGTGSDGKFPRAGVVIKAGELYGTTSAGGGASTACPANPTYNVAAGCGIVFRLSRNSATGTWSETILDAFAGQPKHPATPYAVLMFDKAGNIYGTSLSGGAHSDFNYPTGYGTAFELSPPASAQGGWKERVLHSFGGQKDGQLPLSGLVSDATGHLYGATEQGGYISTQTFSLGTVFELSPPVSENTGWTEKVLANFDYFGTVGSAPASRLVLGPAGVLYGSTANGQTGTPNTSYGTIFKVTP